VTQVWTLDEARAYLPRVRVLLAALRRLMSSKVAVRSNGHAPGVIKGLPSTTGAGHDAGVTSGFEGPIAANEALAELEARGIVLRDVATGLLDFPAVSERGTKILLCWRSDEDDVEWWHMPEEGFAGRKPLPVPPEV
jgi:hypothetical protein